MECFLFGYDRAGLTSLWPWARAGLRSRKSNRDKKDWSLTLTKKYEVYYQWRAWTGKLNKDRDNTVAETNDITSEVIYKVVGFNKTDLPNYIESYAAIIKSNVSILCCYLLLLLNS